MSLLGSWTTLSFYPKGKGRVETVRLLRLNEIYAGLVMAS